MRRPGLVLVTALLLAGCERYSPSLWIDQQAAPFFWSGGQRVFLTVDSTFLAVDADSASLVRILRAWPGIGVAVDSVSYQRLSLRLVFLRRGTTAQGATAAAHVLRLEPGVRFASVGYRLRTGSSCGLAMLNRVMVAYLPSTPPDRIAALHARAGFTVTATPGVLRPYWTLRYPAGSEYTPLEVAAALTRHPYAQWALPDYYGCVGPTRTTR